MTTEETPPWIQEAILTGNKGKKPEKNKFTLPRLHLGNKTILKKKDPVEPLLILMKENNKIEITEGASEGPLYLEDKKQKDGKRMIILDSTKLQDFPYYDGGVVKAWIVYENEATAYPTDVQHDSRMLRRIIERLIMNYKDLDTGKANWRTIMAIGIFVVIIIILGQQFGWFDALTGAKKAGEVISQAASNITTTTPTEIINIGG